MGIDATHLINHDLFFKHTDEFIQQVEEITGMPVFVETHYSKSGKPNVEAPENFVGWTLYTENELTLQEYFEKGGMLELRSKGTWVNEISMYVNPYLFEVMGDEFYMGRWQNIIDLANWIYKNGIPPTLYYETNTKDSLWFFKQRKNLFNFCSLFKTQQPKMLTFCDDKHGEWLDYFYGDKWSMDDYLRWSKKELIGVNFNELVDFEFPGDNPDYFNVCIEDDFSDLKYPADKWIQPMYELNFVIEKNAATQALNYEQLIKTLTEEANNLKLNIETVIENQQVTGHVYWLRKDFQEYLGKHFLTSFFSKRKIQSTIISKDDLSSDLE